MTPADRAGRDLTVLGIETSCDETAAAVVRGPGHPQILSDVIRSQIDEHTDFGGVVPEIAARAHIAVLDRIVAEAMEQAGVGFDDIDAVAATAGPGLIGGVIVGLMTAKAIAMAAGKPLVAVNHLEGHALTARLTDGLDFPYLLLLVSGGHSQFLLVTGVGAYERLGTTIDDAVGEAFDKTAKLLGLPYPGGPELARLAQRGDPTRFRFPRPMTDRPGLDFSFSGLKTFALTTLREAAPDLIGDDQTRADIARAFEDAVVDTLAIKCRRALEETGLNRLVVAGGVGANQVLRARLRELAEARGGRVYYPRPAFCTDNGAMIAYAGFRRLQAGQHEPLAIEARARWLLTDLSPLPA